MTCKTLEVAVCCSRRLSKFVEQPRVLDGDNCLGSEVLDQLDLLVGEGTNFLAVRGNAPISSSSFSIGTARNVRTPPSSTAAPRPDLPSM